MKDELIVYHCLHCNGDLTRVREGIHLPAGEGTPEVHNVTGYCPNCGITRQSKSRLGAFDRRRADG